MLEWVSLLALLAAIAAGGAFFTQRRQLRDLRKRLEHAFSHTEAQPVALTIAEHVERLSQHERRLQELVRASEYLHTALQFSVRHVALERYNPFPGVGGNQSFTLVLLDEHGSGVVLTSLHNRDATRVYAKAIREGQPLHQLSSEEERVVKNAMGHAGA